MKDTNALAPRHRLEEAPAVHKVAVLALHGVVPFDLSIPCEMFGRLPGDLYRVRVCGESPEVQAAAFTLRVEGSLEDVVRADTVFIPGVDDPRLPVPDAVLSALRAAAERGARLASICSGAFVLAATGLLDGRRATTHWTAAPMLAQLHPAIRVDPNVLFVDEGAVLTSAGASAGLDLCLHIIRRDHGHAVAAEAARLAVAPLERTGGQAQFMRLEPPRAGTNLAPLLEWMTENVARPLTLEAIAAKAGLSSRTLSRRFREQLDSSPLKWLHDARVRRAQELLETADLDVTSIAVASGFVTPSNFREHFRQSVGVSPTIYRRTFKR